MRHATWSMIASVWLSAPLVFVWACSSSSSSSSGSTSDAFVGTWQCAGSSTTNVTAPVTTTVVVQTMTQVAISDDGKGNVTATATGEGDGAAAPCTHSATLSADGNTLTAKTPFACPGNPPSITRTTTMSSSTMGSNKTSYTTSNTFTLSGTNAQGKMFAASGSASGTCTKQ